MNDLLVAAGIGAAFGFALERAGLGSARKLAGQFLLRDLTVLKVMFSAIVTAMLGTFWLGRLGLIDVAFLYVPDTYLAPQLAGGAIFGVGFALASLCPGTSCVSAATGRGDGAAVVLGLFTGVAVTGFSFAPLRAFYESGAHGAWTLPQLLHLPYGTVVLLVVLLALALFLVAERLEAPRLAVGSDPAPQGTASVSVGSWPSVHHGSVGSDPGPRYASMFVGSADRTGLDMSRTDVTTAFLQGRSWRSMVRWLGIAALALGAAAAIAKRPAPAAPAAQASAPAPYRPASGC